MEWNSIGNEDVFSAIENLNAGGYDIALVRVPFDNHSERDDKGIEKELTEKFKEEAPDFVFSFNYWAIISKACNAAGVKYAAWVYDNPAVNLFSYTLINPCNYVFLFDSQVYELFASQGFETVYYLPMAAAVDRYDSINITDGDRDKWGGEVSFVGGLYTEGHNYYDQIEPKLSGYAKGYLQGIMRSQMEVQGMNIVERQILPQVMKEMVDALGLKPNYDGIETYEYIYSNYVINRKITAIERSELIEMIGKRHPINLYTRDSSFKAHGVSNRGRVDYYNEMPYVFKTSDINLNITLRSIQRGIPLRAVDIMGCGGFLLTNYQEDMLQFFEPGKDFVYYESRSDLMDKIDYYLKHEDERRAIAESGHAKVKANHKYEQRLATIIETVMGQN